MNDQALRQVDAFTTPGTLLRRAREAHGISEREAADQLNFMPDYVAILERDEYQSLRSPAFARGYVRSYGRMLGLDEQYLMQLFDAVAADADPAQHRRIETRPLQLQRTGLGVVIGLTVLLLLVLALWWWRGEPVQGGSADRAATVEESIALMRFRGEK